MSVLGIILIAVNLIAFLIVVYYGYSIGRTMFNKGVTFTHNLNLPDDIDTEFDDNIHRLDSIRSCKYNVDVTVISTS